MFKNILLAVDLNEPGSWKRALPAALETAKVTGGELYVITVAPDVNTQVAPFFPTDVNQQLLKKATEELGAWVKKNVAAETPVKRIVGQGSIYREILNAAEETGADLIVMAAHKPGIRDYLLGANAAHVVRHFSRSVLIVRD
jgi:nucleotide-binding universal stress UspA family protein